MAQKRVAMALVPVRTDLAQQWANKINRTLGDAVAAIIATGQALIAAKHDKALRHGGWERMFKGHKEAVANPVPFGAETARNFMRIAEHPLLANPNHGWVLPSSWRTLYELTKVPEATLRRALTDGRITPAM